MGTLPGGLCTGLVASSLIITLVNPDITSTYRSFRQRRRVNGQCYTDNLYLSFLVQLHSPFFLSFFISLFWLVLYGELKVSAVVLGNIYFTSNNFNTSLHRWKNLQFLVQTVRLIIFFHLHNWACVLRLSTILNNLGKLSMKTKHDIRHESHLHTKWHFQNLQLKEA